MQINFKSWMDALATKNPSTVASLYVASGLSFLPTVSPNFIRDNSAAELYFVDFLKKTPTGTITAEEVSPLSIDAYLHAGTYTFYLGPAKEAVQARFSYVWTRISGVWKILHHHSSVVPGATNLPVAQLLALASSNFKAWNDALSTGDKSKVASMYTNPMSFLPTVSPDHIKNTQGAEDYFSVFLKKKPSGKITDEEVTQTGPNSYVHSGKYIFELDDDRKKVPARFSYLWTKDGDQWKIAHHHSSIVPGTENPVDVETLMPTVQVIKLRIYTNICFAIF